MNAKISLPICAAFCLGLTQCVPLTLAQMAASKAGAATSGPSMTGGARKPILSGLLTPSPYPERQYSSPSPYAAQSAPAAARGRISKDPYTVSQEYYKPINYTAPVSYTAQGGYNTQASYNTAASYPAQANYQAEYAAPNRQPTRLSNWQQDGWGAYYGEERHGYYTASGEVFDMNAATAAHATLPFGTIVRVTNLYNGRHVDLRINDRCGHATRMIDVSKFAAYHLQMLNPGVVPLSIRVWE